jgi:hypothetical protein
MLVIDQLSYNEAMGWRISAQVIMNDGPGHRPRSDLYRLPGSLLVCAKPTSSWSRHHINIA